jgi:CRP/FNR family transcriptional regulator, cyclic AMP receptor protein
MAMSGIGDYAGLPSDSLLLALPAKLSQGLFALARPLQVKAGKTLFAAGDKADGCYVIEEGLLKVTVGLAGKGERILAILVPGSIVGEFSVIDGSPRSAGVVALKDSRLGFVNRIAFQSFVAEHPEFFRHLALVLISRLRDTNATVATTSFMSLKGRAARVLLALAEAFGRNVGSGRVLIHQKISQSDLAGMAGIARENMSRILNDWMKASVVSRLSGYYCLEDEAKLRQEAQR